jgi:hypothetical protein
LQSHGKTISDAVEFYVKHLEATQRSAKVWQALDELIEQLRSRRDEVALVTILLNAVIRAGLAAA